MVNHRAEWRTRGRKRVHRYSMDAVKDVHMRTDLTGRRFPAEWLATKLADPARFRAGTNGDMTMPDLGLDEPTVSALVSYINQPRSTAVGSGR